MSKPAEHKKKTCSNNMWRRTQTELSQQKRNRFIKLCLFNYQHNIHSHNTRSATRGNFILEYSILDKQNMSFSRNGVRIWNNLPNEIRQMPKGKFKHNIHNMLLQRLSEANEYIDLLDLNMP